MFDESNARRILVFIGAIIICCIILSIPILCALSIIFRWFLGIIIFLLTLNVGLFIFMLMTELYLIGWWDGDI